VLIEINVAHLAERIVSAVSRPPWRERARGGAPWGFPELKI
jgi:hypothetical protein